MDPLPVSALIYLFNGTVALWYGLRNFNTYKKTGNQYSKKTFWIGIGVSAAEYFYGVPNLFFPDNPSITGSFYILAIFPLIVGLANGLKILFEHYPSTIKIINWGVPLLVLLFIFVHFKTPPQPFTDELGLIHWRIDQPFNYIFIGALSLTTVIPGIYWLISPSNSRKSFLKKILFGITFILGGVSGGLLLTDNTLLLTIFFTGLFLAFVSLASIFLVDIFVKE